MKTPVPITEIFKILPHTYPFLLVDRVLEMNKIGTDNAVGSTIEVLKNVTFNEPFFPGHFPGQPIMPGVLIVEAMAQAAALLAYKPRADGQQRMFYMVSVNDAKFRKPVVPGDQLKLTLTCVKDRGSMYVFEGRAMVESDLVAEAEIMAKMV